MAKFCIDCKHSRVISKRLFCVNQRIISQYPEQLAKLNPTGVPCLGERQRFRPCGIKGALWLHKRPEDYALDKLT